MHGVEFHYLDIDECADETSGCEQLCNNNNGSYSCACQDNYTLALDIRSCLGTTAVCLEMSCTQEVKSTGPPQNVFLNASSSMTLKLVWEAPELDVWDGHINSYEVNCTSAFGYYHFAHEDDGLLEYDLYSLDPFSTYTCCVRALTTNGDSVYSCDTETTLQDSAFCLYQLFNNFYCQLLQNLVMCHKM